MPDIQAEGDQPYPTQRCPGKHAHKPSIWTSEEHSSNQVTITQGKGEFVHPGNSLEHTRDKWQSIDRHGLVDKKCDTQDQEPEEKSPYPQQIEDLSGRIHDGKIANCNQHPDREILQEFALIAINNEEHHIEERTWYQKSLIWMTGKICSKGSRHQTPNDHGKERANNDPQSFLRAYEASQS